jgi:hypothetical protein
MLRHSDEAWIQRKVQWSKDIDSNPSIDPVALTAIVKELRNVAEQYRLRQITNPVDVEWLAMDYVAKSVRFGAFSGIEWLVWRTKLSNKPHISNAVVFLQCPPAPLEPPPLERGMGQGASAAIIMANVIETLIARINSAGGCMPKIYSSAGQHCWLEAQNSFERATSNAAGPNPKPLKNVWKWLRDHDDNEYGLPKFATWSAYIRKYHNAIRGANQNHSRRGRVGRSIVRDRDS